MRILHAVEFYWPSVGGSQEVVRQLSERLARRGHDVHVATSRLPTRDRETYNGVRIHEFDVAGKEVTGFRGADIASYREFLRGSGFDVVMAYAAQQWSFDLLKTELDDLDAAAVCVPCGYSALPDPRWRGYFRELPGYLRRFDACVYNSHAYRDVRFAERHRLDNGVFVPNAADREFLEADPGNLRERYGIDRGETMWLCVGAVSVAKGQDRLLSAFRRARAGGTLVLVGDASPRTWTPFPIWCRLQQRRLAFGKQPKQVRFLQGLPRRDVVAAFAAADGFLFGSRVECSPLVLYEAAAAGTPFVTRDCGNAGEIAAWTRAGVVVRDNREMASWMDRLAAAPELRARMGAAGREAVRDRFNWEAATTAYEQLYSRILARRRRRNSSYSRPRTGDGANR